MCFLCLLLYIICNSGTMQWTGGWNSADDFDLVYSHLKPTVVSHFIIYYG